SECTVESREATVSGIVSAVNDAPVASNGSASTSEDTSVDVDLRTLVSDVDNPVNSLTFTVGNAVNGSVALLGDGHTARFTPAQDYNGNGASFTFKANDGALDSNEATVTVSVSAVNDAPVASNSSRSTSEDTSVDVDLRTLVSDVDNPVNSLTFTVGNAVNGSVALLGDGHTARFTPAQDYNGNGVSFTFKANDGSLDSNEATVTISVSAVNDAPVASNGSASTSEDTAVDVDLRTLVSDVDNAVASLSFSVANAVNGSVVLLVDGHTARFTPAQDYNGSGASFTFKANDGALDSNEATVTISVSAVNDAPVASNGSASTSEDAAVDVDLRTLVSDVDNAVASLTFTVSNAVNGSVVLLGDGHTAHFTPAQDYNGNGASFTFKANDGALDSNEATVTISVSAVNDAPVASNGSASTSEDTAVDVDLRTLVSDVDNAVNSLTFTVSNAVNGSVVLLGDGHTAHFTPAQDYNGNGVSFTFKANDGSLDSNEATVTISVSAVNDAPVASNGSASTSEDTAVDVDLRTLVSDVDNAVASLSFSVANAVNGSVVLLGDGHTARFTPAQDYNGNGASFTFKANDGALDSNEATVTVSVSAVNDAPVASNGSASTSEDTAVEVDLRTLVSDVDNAVNSLTFSVANAVNGSVVLLGDGHTARFTPAQDYAGNGARFTFKADDGALDSNEATVTVSVSAVNDAPVASNGSASTSEDTAVDVDLRTLVSDVDNPVNSLTFTVGNAVNGSVVLLGDGHTARFTPAQDYNGNGV